MTLSYEKIIEKLNNKECVLSSDVTTEQLLMLYHDRYMKVVRYKHTLYELNLVPIENNEYKYLAYDKADCLSFLETIVKMLVEGQLVYILIQGEPFQIELEVLETK